MEQVSCGVAECGHAGQIFRTGKCANCYIADLEKIAELSAKFRDGFNYNPGHSDLDREQPIHIAVTLGQWSDLDFALRGHSQTGDRYGE